MAIFNRNIDEYPEIEATAECGYKIAEEGFNDIDVLTRNLEASNILIESGIYDAEFESVMEASMKDTFEKAKQKFIEFGKKIKEWFKKAIEYIKEKFSKVTEFAKKYKDKILPKLTGKYKIDHHKFNTNILEDIKNYLEKIQTLTYSDDVTNDVFKEGLLKVFKFSINSTADIKDQIYNEYVGKLYENDIVTKTDLNNMIDYILSNGFNKPSYKLMYNIIEDSIKHKISFTQDLIQKNMQLDEITGKSHDFDYRSAIIKIQNSNVALNMMQKLNTIAFEINNMIVNEYVNILKKVSHKSAKFAEEISKESSENISLYESALSMF